MRELLALERLPHRFWRRIARRSVPPLTTPEKAASLLDKWQTLVPTFGGEERIVRLIDPRERTIESVAPELEGSTEKPN